MKKIFIITGEDSGDLHGAELVKQLRTLNPSLEIHAVGGERLKALRPASMIEMAHLNATGLTAVLQLLPQYLKKFNEIRRKVAEVKPDMIVFMDNPGFNLRLAKKLAVHNIPMIYYICPQVWAWNQKRVYLMKQLFKKLLVIFEFEKTFYAKYGVQADWVGHPLRDEINCPHDQWKDKPYNKEKPLVLLLPGSRRNEVKYHLPVILKALPQIKKDCPQAQFVLVQAESIKDEMIEDCLKEASVRPQIIKENRWDAMKKADLALVASGTATLECMLHGLPMTVFYKSSALNAFLARRLVKVKYVSLPNLLANKAVVRELLQEEFTPETLSKSALNLLGKEANESLRQSLYTLCRDFGDKPSAHNAAKEILNTPL